MQDSTAPMMTQRKTEPSIICTQRTEIELKRSPRSIKTEPEPQVDMCLQLQ